VVPGSNVVKV
jgi:hypothetical protein